jgi:hypothetical protein
MPYDGFIVGASANLKLRGGDCKTEGSMPAAGPLSKMREDFKAERHRIPF